MLGGRKVEISSRDPEEQRLVNVVEEMSIASGLPVPDIYLLDHEENINAFAAGFGPGDAAIGVTRGALLQLNRDELQGVIAHEFSHIFNGDMNLNIRLIGILNGILLLHIIGLIMMRGSMISGMRGGGSSGRGRGGGGGAIAIVILGISLLVIGYIGMIFGRMIQAAISRQREYLADAAAVQYTRNPEGLAGALRKIGGKKEGGKINDGHAMEMSHLFFANSYHSALDRAFATHPPLEDRIRAIDPAHDKENERKKERIRKRVEKDRIASTAASEQKIPGGAHGALTPEIILASIGTLEEPQMNSAAKLLRTIPAPLREAAHEPFGAESLVYALLISGSETGRKNLPEWIFELTGEKTAVHVTNLLSVLEGGRREWYLPLAELSMPSLRQMSSGQYHTFRKAIQRLTREDGKTSLFEFALEKMITRQLDNIFSEDKSPKIRHHHLKTLGSEIAVLISRLSYASGKDAEAAWKAGLKPVEQLLPEGIALLPENDCDLEQLDHALDEIAASANPVKKYVLSAAIHCITSDRQITIDEKELLRAISEALDCPMPVGVLG
ncbi:MAG: M48 family metallopeptidase [Balneolaceae bacterium]